MTHFANHSPQDRRQPSHEAGIDWEDLPSLAHLVAPVGAAAAGGASWQDTRPASLDDLRPAAAFLERLPGLDVLESTEPEIFKLFFARAPHHAAAK